MSCLKGAIEPSSVGAGLYLSLAQCALSVEGFPFGLATSPHIFTALTKPILFLCHHEGFHIVSVWMTSWSWIVLSGQVRGLAHFCVPY